ncbi:MAG: phosphatase PAP2 family protein [Mycobacterium sp.]
MSRGRWILLAAGLFAGLVALATALNSEWAANLDTSVTDWFDAHRTRPRRLEADGVFGYIGRPVHVLIPAVLLGSLLSWRVRSVIPGLLVTFGVGLGAAVETTFKALVGRTATTLPLVDYPHSYPSGHVTGTAALLGMIAVCLGAGRGRATRTALALMAVAGILFVAVLALYTGAHTFTDVIGGMLLGGAICSLGAAVLQTSATTSPATQDIRRAGARI